MNFTQIIKRISTKYPEKCAIIHNDIYISYQELWERINFVSNLYLNKKIQYGDRILIVLPNSANLIIYHFAALKIGAVSVLVKESFKITEFSTIIENCQPNLLVTTSNWLNENINIIDELKITVEIINVDTIETKDTKNIKDTGIYKVKNSDLASINYSYMGDGYPKGAALTHKNHIYAATGYSRHLGFTHDDIFLTFLPIPHIFCLSGCINTPVLTGSTILVTDVYAPKSIFTYVEKYKITILTGTAVFFESLSNYKRIEKYDTSSLRFCITGGEFMNAANQYKFSSILKKPIIQGYGLTETLPVICNQPGQRNNPGTLGIPGRRDIFVKIVNEKDEEMGIDKIGEIIIKSPTTMSGYYMLFDETNKIMKDGWLYTGDLGKIDNDGYLHFVGLKKKIFNIYGNKIDPSELEKVLLGHPLIYKADVYLETSDNKSILEAKKLCADIYLKNAPAISSSDIRSYCYKKIAIYKIPEKINLFFQE